MYTIKNENIFADSVISDQENYGKSIEVKLLLDATEEEIEERFGKTLREPTLVAYTTINKYNKTLNYVSFEIENPFDEVIIVDTMLSNEEREALRKAAVAELGRYIYQNR